MTKRDLEITDYIDGQRSRSIGDQLADELAEAARNTGLVSSWLHCRRERYAAKSVYATEARHAALQAGLTRIASVIEEADKAQEAAIRSRIRQEMTPLFLQVQREEVLMALQTRLAKGRETLMLADRAAMEAKNGLEATARFKSINFEIGAARKEAEIAEVRETIPDANRYGPSDRFELADAVRLRADLRASGAAVPDSLNRLINRLRDEDDVRLAAE